MSELAVELLERFSEFKDVEDLAHSVIKFLVERSLTKKVAIFILKPNGSIRLEISQGYDEAELNKFRHIAEHLYEQLEVGGNILIPIKGVGFVTGVLVIDNPRALRKSDFKALLSFLPQLLDYYILRESVYQDPLTGLPNYQYLKLRTDEQLHRFYRYEEDFSLALVEIAGYEEIVSTYGLQFAEKLVVKVGEVLKKVLRRSDLLARYSTSTFAILMPHTGTEGIKTFADRLRSTMKFHTFHIMGKSIDIDVNIGVTSSKMESFKDVEEVFMKAEQSLKSSREGGKGYLSSDMKPKAKVIVGEKEIIGNSKAMKRVKDAILVAAQNDLPVLILGETGTGKELVARKIHELSPRRHAPFIVIDCGAIPETLLESELFGHERGAFTGAISRKRGLFEIAHGGTIFLDEVEATSLAMQAKLLRVLEEKTIRRVGGTEPIQVDIRIIAASNTSLEKLIKEGKFRKDLFFRLAGITIEIPPLWERKSDIPLLVDYFVKRAAIKMGKRIPGVSKKVMDAFMLYKWPGNVRELEHEIERAVAFCNDGEKLQFRHLSDRIKKKLMKGTNLKAMVEDFERNIILETLEETGWNEKQAAKRLGIARTTLISKIKKYGITIPKNFKK